MNTIHVVLAVDPRCVRGCAVSMRSILDNAEAGTALHFHLVVNGIRGHDRDDLARTATDAGRTAAVTVHTFDPAPVSRFLRSKLITHTAYARLFLGDLLGPELSRCIYVDCDLLFQRDVRELWETDLGGRSAGAVDNAMWQDSREHQRRLGLAEPRYFNSGVLLIDLDRWRERRVGERALAIAERVGDRLILHDQDALNGALEGDWLALADHWNVWVIDPDLRDDSRAILHYMGAPKPWHADYAGPFRDRFFAYLDRTPFRGWRPWNPAGLGATIARLRRRTPYLPTVARTLRAQLLAEVR